MGRILWLAGFIVVATACQPAQLSQDGLFGSYVVNGVDPVGTEYSGRVSISRAANSDDVVMEWIITGAIIRGEGIVSGNSITVEWETLTDAQGTSSGTATYEILDNGNITGTLRVDGFDQVGTETIYPEP